MILVTSEWNVFYKTQHMHSVTCKILSSLLYIVFNKNLLTASKICKRKQVHFSPVYLPKTHYSKLTVIWFQVNLPIYIWQDSLIFFDICITDFSPDFFVILILGCFCDGVWWLVVPQERAMAFCACWLFGELPYRQQQTGPVVSVTVKKHRAILLSRSTRIFRDTHAIILCQVTVVSCYVFVALRNAHMMHTNSV